MRFSDLLPGRRHRPAAAPRPRCCAPVAPAPALDHCHGTLVLHADGTAACEVPRCDADEVRHELWLACAELGCGCAGDEADLLWAQAA